MDPRPPDPPELTIVAPVYNEETIVAELVNRVLRAARSLAIPFELIVVDDGSRDHTLPTLIALSADCSELRVLSLLRNFGHMHALDAGIAAAQGQAVLVLDGDLQDPPELIPAFVDEWRRGADVVYGLRTERHETPLKQFATGLFYSLLHSFAETPIPRQVGTFSIMDRRIVDVLLALPERHRYFAGLRAWAGGKQTFVPYERLDRTNGRSRVGLRGLFGLARTAMVSFSTAPLRLTAVAASLAALAVLIAGLTGLGFGLFSGQGLAEWVVPVIAIGFIALVQSLALGAMAEYLAVIIDEVKARPSFVLRQEFRDGCGVATSLPRRAAPPEPAARPFAGRGSLPN